MPSHSRPDRTDRSRRPRILLRSSWQSVNIGDIAHSPGAIRAFELFAPEAEIALWPCSLEDRERTMFARHLPHVRIVEGELTPEGRATTPELADAFDWADVMVHGSGPHAVRAEDVDAWRRRTGKPYGFFGITVDPVSPPTEATLDDLGAMIAALPEFHLSPAERDLYQGASFLYCRDTLSLDYLQGQNLAVDRLEFGPDATFAFDLWDLEQGDEIRAGFGLEDGQFICLVPGVRWTPYHDIRGIAPGPEDLRRAAVNAAHNPRDRAVLRRVVTEWVRSTGLPVLVVPEMTYEVDLARDYFADLDADVADRVHPLPGYWGPSTAAAVYSRARAVVSIECHTPIMSMVAGVPALYLRQPTDTCKGRMYADLGAPDAVVEMTPEAAGPVLSWLEDAHNHHAAAAKRARAAQETALTLLQSMVDVVVDVALGSRQDTHR